MRITTMRGKSIDLSIYLAKHKNKPALGNGKMNARGDKIDHTGKVVKPREHVLAEYNQANPKAVKNISIKDMIMDQVILSPEDAVQSVKTEHKKHEKKTKEKEKE